ncbi:MAG: hypothetical protein IT379_32760, partial [Deltaproteobacteria bacterium]|nr:hypothetical protein [Deltaproteobacteria bacterium]
MSRLPSPAVVLALAITASGCGDDDGEPEPDASADGRVTPRPDAEGLDGGDPSDATPVTESGAPDATPMGEDATVAPPGFAFAASPYVALPFTTVGSPVPDGVLELREVGGAPSSGDVDIDVSGELVVEGSTAPLAAHETRTFVVRYTGAIDAPVNAVGNAAVSIDGARIDVALAAVVGDPALPPVVEWTEEGGTAVATAPYPSAPFPDGRAAYADARVLVASPVDLDDARGVPMVVHLHGHNALLARTVPAQHLVRQLALSGRNAVLVVPQGPVEAADGDFGKLDLEGGLARLARDVIAVLYRDGLVRVPRLGPVVLTSHSGGYSATANIVAHGGVTVAAVHLFDSLYGRSDAYFGFASGGGLLRSVYTSGGGTDRQNLALATELESAGVVVTDAFDDDTLASSRTTIGFTPSSHNGCVSDERAYARWLFASGLPRRPAAPPELLATLASGTDVVVRWRAEVAPFDGTWRVEGSDDATRWDTLA